jgi:hypothetical protein
VENLPQTPPAGEEMKASVEKTKLEVEEIDKNIKTLE